MFLSSRMRGLSDSITMQLNEKAIALSEEGYVIYNLSAGQLPVKPPQEFIEKIQQQLNFLRSYQYSPVAGFPELRKQLLNNWMEQRKINPSDFDCVISNGSKHSIYNVLGTILDPGDEVVILAPYWVSYPEMIKFWGGVPQVFKSQIYDAFVPSLEDLPKLISSRTKAIIINSPNNPAGIYYPSEWMKSFAMMMKDYPEILLLSDEIYADISYFDPKPTYFYQYEPALLERTIVFSGISKSLASTGLRLGFTYAPKVYANAVSKIQGQTTSGASSLIQRALMEFDFTKKENFLDPIKHHLRRSSSIIRDKWKDANLHHSWYQSNSAFYFMVDFSSTPCFQRYQEPGKDFSKEICQELLEHHGMSMVPGGDFGLPNSARISLVMEEVPFTEAMAKLISFLIKNT
jgi:aspartate aminotransferase